MTASPRSDAEPMAFTAGEFIRGALWAWGLFLGVSTLAFVPFYMFAFWLPLYVTVPWSFGALIIGSPFAYALGRLLRRVGARTPHVMAFTAFGATIGAATTALAFAAPWTGLSQPGFGGYFAPAIVVCAAATLAVPFGWWIAVTRALRTDGGEPAHAFGPRPTTRRRDHVMRIAITGGMGFVGRHLAERLGSAHTVIVSRRTGVDIDDVDALAAAFAGCDAVAHCAGINREIGDQTFDRVHVEGTRAVIEAARRAGVRRIVMVSFLRARPGTASGYHDTKWQAEELIRASGIDHTILTFGMIYGPGDHMIDHVTRAVRTFPVFATVGYRERRVRPVPIADAVDILVAALDGRIDEPTVAVMGAEELELGAAVRRVARVAGRSPLSVRAPIWAIRALAQLTEWTMVTPLVAKAQAQMLAEGVDSPAPWAPEPPPDLRPRRPFDEASIRAAMPTGRFGLRDLRLVASCRKSSLPAALRRRGAASHRLEGA